MVLKWKKKMVLKWNFSSCKQKEFGIIFVLNLVLWLAPKSTLRGIISVKHDTLINVKCGAMPESTCHFLDQVWFMIC
jgi:hypothetical protein